MRLIRARPDPVNLAVEPSTSSVPSRKRSSAHARVERRARRALPHRHARRKRPKLARSLQHLIFLPPQRRREAGGQVDYMTMLMEDESRRAHTQTVRSRRRPWQSWHLQFLKRSEILYIRRETGG